MRLCVLRPPKLEEKRHSADTQLVFRGILSVKFSIGLPRYRRRTKSFADQLGGWGKQSRNEKAERKANPERRARILAPRADTGDGT